MANRNFLGQDTPQSRAAQANQIWEARQRTRQDVVDRFETVDDPRDVGVDQRRGGLGPSEEFLGWAEPQEAAHEFDPEFPHQDLASDDVERVDDGFRPTEGVQREHAAHEFEADTPLDNIDPFGDIVQNDDGFGLAEPRQRDIAAHELDDEFPHRELTRDDVVETGDGFGPTEDVQREYAAYELDPEFPAVDIGAGDVERVGDGFGLGEGTQRRVAATQFEDDTPLEDVDPQDDLQDADDGYELTDPAIDRIFDIDPGFF